MCLKPQSGALGLRRTWRRGRLNHVAIVAAMDKSLHDLPAYNHEPAYDRRCTVSSAAAPATVVLAGQTQRPNRVSVLAGLNFHRDQRCGWEGQLSIPEQKATVTEI